MATRPRRANFGAVEDYKYYQVKRERDNLEILLQLALFGGDLAIVRKEYESFKKDKDFVSTLSPDYQLVLAHARGYIKGEESIQDRDSWNEFKR